MADDPVIVAAKAELRRELRRRREELDVDQRGAGSAAICAALQRMIEPTATVMLYLAIRSEVDLAAFVAGHPGPIVSPRVQGKRLVPVPYDEGRAVVVSPFGVPEPVGEPVDPATIDVVCVPGLAFDRAGGRLGYGAGFYDRFLPSVRPGVRTIGIGFSIQVVERVPVDDRDRMLDLILTEEGIVGGAAAGNRS